MRAAIVDTDLEFCRQFKSIQNSLWEKMEIKLQIDIYESAEKLLCAYIFYDVYFITIELPGMNGFELMGKLRRRHEEAEYVFVSDDDSLMQEAFFLRPYAFIRKKNLVKDSKCVLFHLKKSLEKKKGIVMLYSGKKEWRINPIEIIYCSSEEHYVYLYYKDEKKQREMLRMKLDELEEHLEGFDFMRIHRNFLVNLDYVSGMEGKLLYLKDKKALPISRRMQKDVERTLDNWRAEKEDNC